MACPPSPRKWVMGDVVASARRSPPCTVCNRKRPGMFLDDGPALSARHSRAGHGHRQGFLQRPPVGGPIFPHASVPWAGIPALQGLTDTQICLQSRRANLVLCSQSGRAFCVCSAGTRKELRSSCSDTSQRSTHLWLKWLSWPKVTSPWDPNDEMVQASLVLVMFLLEED